jgi:hypothetical protein
VIGILCKSSGKETCNNGLRPTGGHRYWLYVVYDCAGSYPRLMRVNHPFLKLLIHTKTSVVVDQQEIFQAVGTDE